jgi:DNA-directed RNA polymerase specialized sigma24 family protein
LNKILEILYKKHKQWVEIVETFGCNKQTAEDLVQEMYIKIAKKIENGTDILYNKNEVNYFYIYLTLKTLFLDLKRKESKVSVISLSEIRESTWKNIIPSNYNNMINFENTYRDVKNELNKMYWYDKKVWQIIESGQSIAELSRKSGIPYYSLYNTYKKVKEKLKKLL